VSEVAHRGHRDRYQRLLCRRDLGERIGAVVTLFDHALQTANLPLGPTATAERSTS
jgi:hypothetical protein